MPRLESFRHRVFTVLERAAEGDRLSHTVDLALMALIALNGLAVVLESLPSLARYRSAFATFDALSVTVFLAEYLLRLWSCTTVQGTSPLRGRLRYALRPLLLIDLAAILPSLLLLSGVDLRLLRLVRLSRLLRLAKLGRYSTALQLLGKVLRTKREELLLALGVGGLALIISATLIYFAEGEAQPQAFPSIPAALWWSVTTLTTVGYGDAYPITVAGKLVGAMAQIIGVGLFALPAGILAGGYLELLQAHHDSHGKPSTTVCPHCGKALNGE